MVWTEEVNVSPPQERTSIPVTKVNMGLRVERIREVQVARRLKGTGGYSPQSYEKDIF